MPHNWAIASEAFAESFWPASTTTLQWVVANTARPASEFASAFTALAPNQRITGAQWEPVHRTTLGSALNASKIGAPHQHPTALVREAWLKISGDDQRAWNGRQHFFA